MSDQRSAFGHDVAHAFPIFVAAGEALTDMIRSGADCWRSQPGGATWNVARVMARLSVPSAFAGAVSDDLFGQALVAVSASAGLDCRFLQTTDRAPLFAFVHQLQPPAYFFVGDDSADLHFDPALLPEGWLAAAQWLHFGGISLAREPLAGRLIGLARQARHAGARISYDPNFRTLMCSGYDDTLRTMTALADVIKVSDDDLLGLFRTDDLSAAFAALRSFNPGALYLLTCGAKGAALHRGERAWHLTPPPLAVVDTVGAGDASMGGLIYSLLRHSRRRDQDHLRYAVAAGSAACLAAGASPPAAQLVERLYRACPPAHPA
ncbi:MAG: sugar kinase [Massilia sp.]|nr:sugar kinase [Massilia sp.]